MGTCILSHGESGQYVKLATSIKVKNEWNYIYAFPICTYGMDRNTFTLFIYLYCLFIFIIEYCSNNIASQDNRWVHIQKLRTYHIRSLYLDSVVCWYENIFTSGFAWAVILKLLETVISLKLMYKLI